MKLNVIASNFLIMKYLLRNNFMCSVKKDDVSMTLLQTSLSFEKLREVHLNTLSIAELLRGQTICRKLSGKN